MDGSPEVVKARVEAAASAMEESMVRRRKVRCLSDLPLCERDLELLCRQGFVSGEERGQGAIYYKLRFRRHSQQVVMGIGTDKQAADEIRSELRGLQRARRLDQELGRLTQDAARLLRRSKKELEAPLEREGYYWHGFEIRKSRGKPRMAESTEGCQEGRGQFPNMVGDGPTGSGISQERLHTEDLSNDQRGNEPIGERVGPGCPGGSVADERERRARRAKGQPFSQTPGKNPGASGSNPRFAQYTTSMYRANRLRSHGVVRQNEGSRQRGTERHDSTSGGIRTNTPRHRNVLSGRPPGRPSGPVGLAHHRIAKVRAPVGRSETCNRQWRCKRRFDLLIPFTRTRSPQKNRQAPHREGMHSRNSMPSRGPPKRSAGSHGQLFASLTDYLSQVVLCAGIYVPSLTVFLSRRNVSP